MVFIKPKISIFFVVKGVPMVRIYQIVVLGKKGMGIQRLIILE